jgi:phage FluMu gp28-like protein
MALLDSSAVRLLDYQKRWIEDRSRLKIAVKGRQEGYSFCAALEAVVRCLERKTTWIFLSKGERQSKLLMDKVASHLKAMGVMAELIDSHFMEGTLLKQLEARLSNGSVIYALPANPDTARGYSGNVTLDEFAFHQDAAKIYAALYPTVTRGYSIEVISTPNGKQGMFFELARRAGLVEGEEGDPAALWSTHRVDIYEATAQGLADMVPEAPASLPPDLLDKASLGFRDRGIQADRRMIKFVAALRAGIDDEETWLQEFCCQFVSTAENFFPPELLAACVSREASVSTPLALLAGEPGEFYLGIDIGRQHDRTVMWLDKVRPAMRHSASGEEFPTSVATARHVRTILRRPFAEQLDAARELMRAEKDDGETLVRRACIDATGIGAMLAETLQAEFGHRIEPVVFTASVKEDLAFRTKRLAEAGQIELPDDPAVRRAFSAVKKTVTASGSIRFDAARTDAGHADEFWAKSLADLAADMPTSSWRDAALVGRPLGSVFSGDFVGAADLSLVF